MTNYFSIEELETLKRRIQTVINEDDRRNTLKSVLSKAELNQDVYSVMNELECFDSEFVSTHKNLTLNFIERHPDLFELKTFMEKSENVILCVNKDFREKFSVQMQDIIDFIRRQRKISDKDFELISIDDNPAILAALISKTDINGNEVVRMKIEDVAKAYGDEIINMDWIRAGKVEISSTKILDVMKKEVVSIDSLIVAFNALHKFPVEFEEYISFIEEKIANNEFIDAEAYLTESMFLSIPLADLAGRFLSCVFRLKPSLLNQAMILHFLQLRFPSEDVIVKMYDVLKAYLRYDFLVAYARKREFNQLLLALSLSDDYSLGDDDF